MAAWTGLSAQADPFIGTWKLDLAKSKYSPGPPPKSGTLRTEAAGEGVKVTAETIRADGTKAVSVYTSARDGKDVPIVGLATADATSVKRLDAHTQERTDKKAGKVVLTYKQVVAPDGKTRTSTQTGTNAEGRP